MLFQGFHVGCGFNRDDLGCVFAYPEVGGGDFHFFVVSLSQNTIFLCICISSLVLFSLIFEHQELMQPTPRWNSVRQTVGTMQGFAE